MFRCQNMSIEIPFLEHLKSQGSHVKYVMCLDVFLSSFVILNTSKDNIFKSFYAKILYFMVTHFFKKFQKRDHYDLNLFLNFFLQTFVWGSYFGHL